MSASAQVNDRAVLLSLGGFRATVADRTAMYRILGALMVGSIQQTFRDEGSPAGSWVPLAVSTMLRKGYTTGHKLLIMRGRLFGSIGYRMQGDALSVGPQGIPYAAVQNFGSADYRGAQGPLTEEHQAAYDEEKVHVKAHDYAYNRRYTKAVVKRTRKDGKFVIEQKRVPVPSVGKMVSVRSHERHQNIPARPYAVIRPEDPGRMVEALNIYIAGRLPAGGLA